MPKMTVRVILKSGVEFSIKCDKFMLTRNGFQQVTGYNNEGITENQPVYLDFEQVAAGVREGTRLDAMRRRLPAADY